MMAKQFACSRGKVLGVQDSSSATADRSMENKLVPFSVQRTTVAAVHC